MRLQIHLQQQENNSLTRRCFLAKQQSLTDEYKTQYLTTSLASSIPQVVKEGRPPFSGNSLVGGDAPVISQPANMIAFEHGITNAFEAMVHTYTMSCVEDRSRTSKSRKMPVLGDLAITIPRYVINSTSLEDGSTRIAESASAHGVYYTSVPSNNPIELITGNPR